MPYALIIDDEADVLSSIASAVRGANLELLTAATWDEGMNLFHVHSPDVVIADYNLVGSSRGLRLLSLIRQLRPSVRVVLISAYIDDALSADIENTGFVDRAISKIGAVDPIDAILEEVQRASEQHDQPTDWAEFAGAFLHVMSLDPQDFDALDQRLTARTQDQN